MGALQSAGSRRIRPLQRLAKVELQLVLHFLDPISLLQAAQCSRQFYRAADEEFAWAACGEFVVRLPFSPPDDTPALLQSSLLRHAPVCLYAIAESPLSAIVGAVAALRRLRELRLFDRPTEAQLIALLSHPALQSLQSLGLLTQPPPSAAVLELVARTMPQLRSLSMWCSDDEQPDRLEPLRRMASLTELSAAAADRSIAPHLNAIGRLTQLRSLRLHCVLFASGHLQPFFASAAMRQLRHLTLDCPPARVRPGSPPQPSADEQRAAFAALERLESLRLRHVHGVDALLDHVQSAPSLRLLIVECVPQHPGITVRLPSQHTAALQSLLAAAPLLEVRLEGPTSLERWLRHSNRAVFQCSTGAHFDRAVAAQWEALRLVERELRPRVSWVDGPDT